MTPNNRILRLPALRPLPHEIRGLCAYLGGPVSGVEDAWGVFHHAALLVSGLGYGSVRIALECKPWEHKGNECPVRPKAGHIGAHSYPCHIRGDLIGMLTECDHIWMLPGWQGSEGCRNEVQVAAICAMPVFFFEGRA